MIATSAVVEFEALRKVFPKNDHAALDGVSGSILGGVHHRDCTNPNSGRCPPGTKVLLTTDGRPDHPFHGTVGFVSPRAEFTPKSVETPELRTSLVYRLRIVVVEDSDGSLRQGMPVTVSLDPTTALTCRTSLSVSGISSSPFPGWTRPALDASNG